MFVRFLDCFFEIFLNFNILKLKSEYNRNFNGNMILQ